MAFPFSASAMLGSGGFVALVSASFALYAQQRSGLLSKRWIENLHFECFEDLADCASTLDKARINNEKQPQRLGRFQPRLRQELLLLRESLKVSGALTRKQYLIVYSALVEAEQALLFNDNCDGSGDGFPLHEVAATLQAALVHMQAAQNALNTKWPKYRTFAESDYMTGLKVLPDTEEPWRGIS